MYSVMEYPTAYFMLLSLFPTAYRAVFEKSLPSARMQIGYFQTLTFRRLRELLHGFLEHDLFSLLVLDHPFKAALHPLMGALSVAEQGQERLFCHLVLGLFNFQKSFMVQERENFGCTLWLWIHL